MAEEITNAEVLKQFESKMTEFKSATTKEAGEKALLEVKAILEASEKESEKKHADFVKQLEEKGAALKDITEEVKELKKKGGRIGGAAEHKSIGAQLADMILEKKDAFGKMASGEKFGEAVEIKTVA